MKKILLSIAAFAMTAVILVSCASKSDPKEVATNFTKALNNLDYETAKKYGTAETGKMLDMLASFSGMMPDSIKEQAKKNKVEVKDVKEDGDKAVVTVANGDKGEETLNLVKQDGKWLVNMTKDEPMGGTPAPTDPGTVPVEDSLPTVGKDSVAVPKP